MLCAPAYRMPVFILWQRLRQYSIADFYIHIIRERVVDTNVKCGIIASVLEADRICYNGVPAVIVPDGFTDISLGS